MRGKPSLYFTLLLAIITISGSNKKFAFGIEGHPNGTLLRSPIVGVMQDNQISVSVKDESMP